jgi:PKHD-type hydroxylase
MGRRLGSARLSRREKRFHMTPDPFSYLLPFAVWENAFTPTELDAIEAIGDRLPLEKATIAYTDGSAAENAPVRVTRTAWMARNPETAWIYERLERIIRVLNHQVYRFDLAGFSDQLQYTVYHADEGGHFDWHIDMIRHSAHRKLSFSLQLSDPAAYEGCDLEIHGGTAPKPAPRTRGALVAFPSYTMHRVTPIRSGTRKALVIWTAGPPFR